MNIENNIEIVNIDIIRNNSTNIGYDTEKDYQIDKNTITKNSLEDISDKLLTEIFSKKKSSTKKSNKNKDKDTHLESITKNDFNKKDLTQENTIQTVKRITNKYHNINLIIEDKKGNKKFNEAAFTNSRESLEEQKKNNIMHATSYEFPYKINTLLTDAEHQFYNILLKNIVWANDTSNRVKILTKVRLGDIVDVDERISSDKKDFYAIACKHIDYIIYDNQHNKIICGLELFDYTHSNDKSKKSDEFKQNVFRAVGIPLPHIDKPVKSITAKDINFINDYIAKHFEDDVKCPLCGAKMHFCRSGAAKNKGHMFYSCNNYPKCIGSINID